MSNIIIKSARVQFKNPQVGSASRAVKEHYFGRNITAIVDGEEKIYRFKPHELAFEADETDMIRAIEQKEIEDREEVNAE